MGILDRIKEAAAPVQRAFAPVRRGIIGAVEAVNPYDAESRGNQLINKTVSEYGVTPQFKNILDKVNPYVSDGGWEQGEGLQTSSKVQGAYYPKKSYGDMNSRVRVSTKNSNPRDTLLHEGLHAAWDDNPTNQGDFINAYMSGADSGLRTYLINRTGSYDSFSKQAPEAFMKPEVMTPDLLGELHSYVPEYYQRGRPDTPPMPESLRNYYSRFYDPQRSIERRQVFNELRGMIGEKP